jgi:hypothetical protein
VVNSDLANVVLTFTDQPTFVRGRVTDRDGRLDSAVLLVFPDDDALRVDYGYGRRVRVIRPQRDGAFEFTNLPEGHYLISAVRTSASDRAVRNPAFLASLESRARRVTVREGATVVQDVEVVTMPRPDAALAPLTVPFPPAERASVLQTPTTALTGGASIAGTVLDVTSKRPLSGVRVALTPALAGVPSPGGAYTDDQGRFLLPVPPGQHTLYASKPQFASTVYGATHPSEPGTPITIGANQRIADVVIQMMKGAAIGGSVLDQNGQPLRGAQVNVRAYRWTARGREMIANRAPGIIGAPTTDARGAFRAYGLPPGEYVVQITPQQGLSTVMPLTTQADVAAASGPVAGAKPTAEPRSGVRYAPMFYPNTIDLARAEAVKLSAGDERFVNFQFSLIPTATISGIVRGPDNNAPERAGVSLALIDPVTPASPVQRIIGGIDATGAFTVRGVAPGRYLLSSTRTTMTPNLFASVEVVVDGDQSGITLDLLPAGTVSGRIGGGAASAGRQQGVRISLSPLANTVGPPNSQLSAAIDTENRFSFSSVPPGRYRLELTGPNTVAKPRVVSQRVGGVETVEAGLEIKGGEQLQVDVELMPSEAQVAGRTRDRAGQPATRPYVVLFAKEPQAWTPPSRRIFGVRPDQNGRYLFPDVPAGDYLVTTVASVEAGEWFNPSVLTKLAPAASPVSVRRGDKLEIDLETR